MISIANVIRSIFTPPILRESIRAKTRPRPDARKAIKPGGETSSESESVDKDVLGFLDE